MQSLFTRDSSHIAENQISKDLRAATGLLEKLTSANGLGPDRESMVIAFVLFGRKNLPRRSLLSEPPTSPEHP